jgi:hypothetical protein
MTALPVQPTPGNDFIDRIRALDHYLSQLDPKSLDEAERDSLRRLYRDLKALLALSRPLSG